MPRVATHGVPQSYSRARVGRVAMAGRMGGGAACAAMIGPRSGWIRPGRERRQGDTGGHRGAGSPTSRDSILMKRLMLAACMAVAACLLPMANALAQEDRNPVAELPWQHGPTTGKIGTHATIRVPEGYSFLDAAATRRFNELLENPPTSYDEYVIAPENLDWIAFFNFNEIGYVKDDESIDADDVLDSVREGLKHGNRERSSRGWDTLRLVGWSAEPRYDQELRALAWAILLESENSGAQVVNYNTRLLGRRGVMEVTVAADPESLQGAIADFKGLVPGYSYVAGEGYGDFRPGDHVAEIGLAALITGGAVAVASKKGWLAAIGVAIAKFWKLLLVGLAGIAVAIRKLFGGKGKAAE